MKSRKSLLDRLKKDYRSSTYQDIAKKIGVNFVTLWRVMQGKLDGNIRFWEKVDEYYK